MSKDIVSVSLFSGAGGLDIASCMAGVPVISSTDFDADCIQTLKANTDFFGKTEIFEGDLHQIESDVFKKIVEKRNPDKFIVIGGAPCQPFSKAGYWVTNEVRKGINDPKLGFKNVEFDVYYRVSIENGSSVDYSNYVIIKSTGSESGGGSESVGESGSTGSGSTGSGSESESSPSQETCPHDRGWVSADTNGSLKCKLCGYVCDHKANTNTVKKTEDWESEYEKGHKHKYSVTCSVCNRATLNFEDPIEPHDYNGGKVEYASDDQHRLTCTKCGYNTLQKCDYEVKKAEYCSDSSFPDAAAKGHNATLVCKVCGHEERVTQEKHNLVNGVCTVCGWKKVTPGKVTGVKIKKSVKRQNKSFGGYWRGLTWVKKTTKAYKICKATIRFKKAKNAAFYVIEKTPKTDTTVADSWTIKTTKLTKEMWFMGNAKKATFKITPYSKEGVKGKTFKKTIKL